MNRNFDMISVRNVTPFSALTSTIHFWQHLIIVSPVQMYNKTGLHKDWNFRYTQVSSGSGSSHRRSVGGEISRVPLTETSVNQPQIINNSWPTWSVDLSDNGSRSTLRFLTPAPFSGAALLYSHVNILRKSGVWGEFCTLETAACRNFLLQQLFLLWVRIFRIIFLYDNKDWWIRIL